VLKLLRAGDYQLTVTRRRELTPHYLRHHPRGGQGLSRRLQDPVSPDYTAHTSRFNGKIDWVRIDLGEDAKDADHYIDPDERFRISMSRQ
jgi:hypothetical protein